MFYILDNDELVLFDDDKQKLKNTLQFMPQYTGEIDETDIVTAAELHEYRDKVMVADVEKEIDVPDYETVEEEIEVEVFEFQEVEKEIQQVIVDEMGEPILDEHGELQYETVIVTVKEPIMIEVPETDEEGNPITWIDDEGIEHVVMKQVQKSHMETQIIEKEVQTGTHKETIIVKGLVINPNWEAGYAQQVRNKLDQKTLTPADVERALYRAKNMDFDDLKTLIQTQAPQIDIKAIGIELRANLFYRGAMNNGLRLIDTIGALLGYTPQDMDYLFEHKELPEKE